MRAFVHRITKMTKWVNKGNIFQIVPTTAITTYISLQSYHCFKFLFYCHIHSVSGFPPGILFSHWWISLTGFSHSQSLPILLHSITYFKITIPEAKPDHYGSLCSVVPLLIMCVMSGKSLNLSGFSFLISTMRGRAEWYQQKDWFYNWLFNVCTVQCISLSLTFKDFSALVPKCIIITLFFWLNFYFVCY